MAITRRQDMRLKEVVPTERKASAPKKEEIRQNKCVVEVYSRVTGFYRPIQGWNKGKQEEGKDRVKYDIKK